MKPAEHERHCSLCEGQYIHDECDGLGLGPPDHAEHEQQPSSEAPINPACMQSFDGRDWASDFRATAKSLGYCDMDEGWLTGWFANAIMRGFDESERRRDAEHEQDQGSIHDKAADFLVPRVRAVIEAALSGPHPVESIAELLARARDGGRFDAEHEQAAQDAGPDDDALFVADVRRKAEGMNPPRLYASDFSRLLALAETGAAQDTLPNAQRRAEYWKAEHLAANAEIESLRKQLAAAAGDVDELALRQKWMATVIAERDRQVAAARAEGKAEGLAEGARATFDAVEEVISRLSTAYSSGAVYLAAVKKFRPAQDEPAPTKPTREDLKAVLEGMLRAAQDEPPCEGEYERGVRAERERCKWHACYCSWSGDVFEECEICSGAPMRRAAQDEHGGKGEA